MHQDHNIPWQTLAAHFFIAPGPNPSYTNKPLNFYPRERPGQGKVFTHFSNAFIRTIHEFAATERQKYPPTFFTQETGDLFTDDVIQDCQTRFNCSWGSGYLNKENQKIEDWINGGKDLGGEFVVNHRKILNLAEAVTALIVENRMAVALTLACHPSVPLSKLYRPWSGPNCGWNRLAKYALQVYVFVNILAEFPLYCQGRKYRSLASYQYLMSKINYPSTPEDAFHCWFLNPIIDEGQKRNTSDWLMSLGTSLRT
ncbi:hypothetical protein EDD11_005109 [Mortierella claussenii]|nr:hypothetical protein EDD11_005109 [Mortierella claussenii]